MDLIIGIDFDGTIVRYDELFYNLAIQKKLISVETPQIKKEIRNQIWKLPNGDFEWQKLQAIVYGEKIKEVKPAEEVLDFFEKCKNFGTNAYIISHKTEYSNLGESKKSFRFAAMNWLRENDFFNKHSVLTEEKVFFEATRKEKIEKIIQLNCSHFIDDLNEIFQEENFPPGIKKILYSPESKSNAPVELVTHDWREISEYFFK